MLETAGLWGKRADMIVRGCLPYNAEPPPAVLAGSDITPINAFYVRNHGPVPDIAPQHWRLTVGGLVDNPLTVTYERLTTEFDQHCVVATLACAGNRRAELLRVRQIPGKEPWAHGAISTAQWCGVRLADILQAADVHIDEGLHVAFDAPDVAEEARPIHRGPQRQVGHRHHRAAWCFAELLSGSGLPHPSGGCGRRHRRAGRRDFAFVAGAQLRHPRPHRWRRRTGRGADHSWLWDGRRWPQCRTS